MATRMATKAATATINQELLSQAGGGELLGCSMKPALSITRRARDNSEGLASHTPMEEGVSKDVRKPGSRAALTPET